MSLNTNYTLHISSRPNSCMGCGHRLADCRCRTSKRTNTLILPGPTLMHGLHRLLVFAEADAVVAEARERSSLVARMESIREVTS